MSARKTIQFGLVLAALWVRAGWAQETAPLDALLAMSPQELETGQAKLTWLGPQTAPIPTLVFTIHGHEVNWEAFRPWQGEEHFNDDMSQRFSGDAPSFTVSIEEFLGAVRSLKEVVSQPPADAERLWFSATVVAGQPEHHTGFEGRLDQRLAREFFVYLRGALHADPKDITLVYKDQTNRDAMGKLQAWGCALELLPKEIPAKDVTAQVSVTAGGLRWNAQGGYFESAVTLTNASQRPIQGPVSLAVRFLTANAFLRNAHGTTCVTHPVGLGFVHLPMPALNLEPGEVLETVLAFQHESGVGIQFTTTVLAGPGER